MKLITYQTNGRPQIGAVQGAQVIDLRAATRLMAGTDDAAFPEDMIALLAAGEAGLQQVTAAVQFATENSADCMQPLNTIILLPPVVRPGKVVALGRNYAAHAAEGGAEPPKFPMLFHKTATSLLGAGGTIMIPPVTDKVDFEAELAVIIGRDCKNVSEDDALDYVAGYTVANDVTARDWQRRTTQFTAGKMLDTFGPLGPALVTRDEIPDPGNLRIQTRLNGQTMQDGHTSMMIFSVPFIISYISQISTLEVGDVILTGTPEGVGYARKPPVFMKAGDEITVEVENVGTLTNTVAAA